MSNGNNNADTNEGFQMNIATTEDISLATQTAGLKYRSQVTGHKHKNIKI